MQSEGCVDVISIGELRKWANTGAFCVYVCFGDSTTATADMKVVHTNDLVTVCKILARLSLRLYKTGKYDWPSYAVVIIIIVIITKQASSCFSVCFLESRKSVF